jgi:hypothetical protein
MSEALVNRLREYVADAEANGVKFVPISPQTLREIIAALTAEE